MAGYKTNLYFLPESGIGAVVLTNSDNGGMLLGRSAAVCWRLSSMVNRKRPGMLRPRLQPTKQSCQRTGTTRGACRAWVSGRFGQELFQ